MKIILDEREEIELRQKATEMGVGATDLFEAYTATMNCNFYQDIHDIALENLDELTHNRKEA